jgi:PAS domain S-box-containing protein
MAEAPKDVVLELAILYELALTVGRSLDPRTTAREFVDRLMNRVSVAYAALWLRDGHGPTNCPGASLFHASPVSRVAAHCLPDDHAQFALLGDHPCRVTSDDPRFAELVAETGVASGVYVLFPLGRFGLLKLFSPRPERLSARLVGQLRPVIDKLAVALEGALAHERLERAERDQRAILAAVPDPVFKLDAQGRLLWWNSAFSAAVGVGESDLRGMRAADSVQAPDRARAVAAVAEILERGSAELDCHITTADGPRLHHLRGVCVTEPDGTASIVGASRDISDRAATLLALRESQARVALALSTGREGLFEWDVESNEVRWSPQWYAMLGYAPGDFPDGPRLEALCHVDDRPSLREALRRMSHGTAEASTDVEIRLRHREGRWLHVLARGALVRGEDGEPLVPRRVTGVHIDITAQKADETRLERIGGLLQSTLESTSDGILLVDPEGQVAMVNERVSLLWDTPPVREGDDAAAFFGIIAAHLAPEPDLGQRLRSLLRRPEAEDFFLAPAPGDRVLECQTWPHRTRGAITGRLWRFADVTVRERATARLRQERDLFLAGAVVVLKWDDAPGFPIAYVSGNAESVLGYRADQLINGDVVYTELIHPEDLPRALAETRQAIESGVEAYEHQPYRLRHADGRHIWISSYVMLIRRPDGTPRQYFGYLLDVTRRLEAERALAEERALLRSLIDSIPDLIFFKDQNRVYLGCNRAFEQYAGRPEHSLVGCTGLDVFPDGGASLDLGPEAGAPTTRVNEAWITYPDGRRALVETLRTPILETSGAACGVIGVARDITERHRAEQARRDLEGQLRQSQKMEAIGQLTGGIAHDFNNMLSVILGYAGLGQEESQTEPTAALRPYFEEIRRSGERARNLVAKMLAFSRQRPSSARVPIDPATGINDVLRMLRPTLAASIHLAANVEPGTPAFLGDAVELHQMLANLIINARDAVEAHGHITVGARLVPAPGGRCATCGAPLDTEAVCIEVTDDGVGIRDEHLPRIFDPFFTTKDVGQGTGMGLSVVHGIVHGCSGHLSVRTSPGRGTAIRLYFPPTPTMPAGDLSTASGETDGAPATNQRRILLVDDEQALRRLVARTLERAGFEVAAYPNGRAAFSAFQRAPDAFDALITDETMPEMTGRELVTAVLALRPDLPVLLTTGFSDAIDRESAFALGVRSYLEKPATLKEILAAVHALFDDASRPEETRP